MDIRAIRHTIQLLDTQLPGMTEDTSRCGFATYLDHVGQSDSVAVHWERLTPVVQASLLECGIKSETRSAACRAPVSLHTFRCSAETEARLYLETIGVRQAGANSHQWRHTGHPLLLPGVSDIKQLVCL